MGTLESHTAPSIYFAGAVFCGVGLVCSVRRRFGADGASPGNVIWRRQMSHSANPDRQGGFVTVAAIALVVGHFLFLMLFFEPAISTPDANSYFAQAKLIARTGRTWLEPESPLQYVGAHWNHIGNNRYYCTHAPGLGLLMAPVYRVFGPGPTVAMNPLSASLSLLGLFLLCRMWVGEGWGLLATALMAFNPFLNEHAHFGDAHSAVCFFFIWGLLFVAKWVEEHRIWEAFAAGVFFGIIPTIRYADVFYLPAIAIFVFLHLRRDRRFREGLAAGVIGLAIPLSWLCVRNQLAFGAFWRTGYSVAFDTKGFFGLRYLWEYAVPHLRMLLSDGCGPVFGLGVLGIAILCARRSTRKIGILSAMLVVPVTIVYMSYFWGPDRQSMRYLIPTFYIYTIGGVWVLRELAEIDRRSACAGSVVVLIVTGLWGVSPSVRSMRGLAEQNGALARITGVVEKCVEPGSILVANDRINQHLDFAGAWRLADAGMLPLFRAGRPQRPQAPGMQTGEAGMTRPPEGATAPEMPFSERRTLVGGLGGPKNVQAIERYGGLRAEELFDAFSQDVWDWAGNERRVYLLIKEGQIGRFERRLAGGDELVTIERIERAENQGAKGRRRGGPMLDLGVDREPLVVAEWKRGPGR